MPNESVTRSLGCRSVLGLILALIICIAEPVLYVFHSYRVGGWLPLKPLAILTSAAILGTVLRFALRSPSLKQLGWLLLAFAAYFACEEALCYRVIPPKRVTTLATYLRWRPDTHKFTLANDEYLRVFGGGAGLLPSGPAAYVFDRTGRMVDWTPDSGDDDEFQAKWDWRETRIERLDRAEAMAWLEKAATQPHPSHE